MHRCTSADSKGTAVGAYDASVDVYRDQLIGSYAATQLRHQEMNAIQEEIANVIRAEGIALHASTEAVNTMTQLNTAIDTKFANVEFVTDTIRTVNETSDDLDVHAADHLAGTHVASGNLIVRGGNQGTGTLVDTGFDGGSVTVIGGRGGRANLTTGGRGGDVTVQGGEAGASVSNIDSADPAGDVFVKGGTNVRVSSRAGDLHLEGGLDSGDLSGAQAGHVHIKGGDHTSTGYAGTAGDVNIEPGHDSHSGPNHGVIRIRGSAAGTATLKMYIEDLPTTNPSVSGRLFTQTAAQLGGSGSIKVICVSA